MAIELKGNWTKGFACDMHTITSVPIGLDEYGNPRYDTTRTKMGELVYQLKNHGDTSAVGKIVDLLRQDQACAWLETMDVIVPIPSTNQSRATQPVYAISRELGRRVGIPVLDDVLEKHAGGAQLKNVGNARKRKALLETYMTLTNTHDLTGKNILLVDDVYRSGSTLSVATATLIHQAMAKDVCVLTMTRTRSNR